MLSSSSYFVHVEDHTPVQKVAVVTSEEEEDNGTQHFNFENYWQYADVPAEPIWTKSGDKIYITWPLQNTLAHSWQQKAQFQHK